MKIKSLTKVLALSALAGSASAQLISPLNGVDYSAYGISAEGGVVIDIVGTSGAQVISQIAAVDLFHGYYDQAWDDLLDSIGLDGGSPDAYIADSILGIQGGYTPSLVAALGGGIDGMSIRLTEFDGDTGSPILGPGVNMWNPDLDPLAAGIDLIVNGENVADFESDTIGGVGFGSDLLVTDFFVVSDPAALAAIFTALSSTGEVVLGYDEGVDKGFAEVDFMRELDPSSLSNAVRPVLVGVIPEPSVIGLLGFASILGLVALRRRR